MSNIINVIFLQSHSGKYMFTLSTHTKKDEKGFKYKLYTAKFFTKSSQGSLDAYVMFYLQNFVIVKESLILCKREFNLVYKRV